MLIQFCFFGAYFICSIPAGKISHRVGYKRGVIIGLCIAGLGALMFYPAAEFQTYGIFLAALFVLASGITLLQVAANPYVVALGPPATGPSRLNLAGTGPVRIFYGLHRLSTMAVDAFQDYWLNTHADVGRALIPPYSYCQSHADSELTQSLATLTGLTPSDLDGVASVHFPDLDACNKQLAREDVSEIALEDERRFID